MEIRELKERLTLDNILEILNELGAETRQSPNLNEIWCKTICHGGDSHKLYLYKDSLNFHCYTSCGSMDIFSLIQNVLGCNLNKAKEYIMTKFGFYTSSFKFGFDSTINTNDLEVANSFATSNEIVKKEEWKPFKNIDNDILRQYYDFYHPSFYNDGICFETLRKYEVKYDILNYRVIIPHRNHDGKLIAIRCRNLDEDLISIGRKYTPIIENGKLLSASTSQYFYGMYFNKDNIKLCKKVILVESEKAVMQYETMFPNRNITLALSSSHLSEFQIAMLKEMQVEEVILALDKEFEYAGTSEETLYRRKLQKTIIDRLNFCNVSILWDTKGLLNMKDSPLDKGKDIFLELFLNRIYVQ